VFDAAGTIAVTFFDNYAAAKKRQDQLTVAEIVRLIGDTTALRKEDLPWLKLARFGNAVTTQGSLRHDRNVIAVSGIELDYDGEAVAFDQAVEIAEKAGLEAIIYTSPSHTPERPRWRVLSPTSREIAPAERTHMCARVNGLYGGIFAAESFTLSQSYYYGSVNGNPDHQAVVAEGCAVDELHELDPGAIGRPHTEASNGVGNGEWTNGPVDEAALLKQIMDGESYHNAAMRLLGRWAHQGISMLEAEARLQKAFDGVFPPDRDQRWHDRVKSIPEMLAYIWGKEAIKRDAQPHGHDIGEGVSLADFYAYMPQHAYMFAPSRDLWPACSVNARIPPVPLADKNGASKLDKKGNPMRLAPSVWLDQNKPVEQMTWAPGLPMVIKNRLISDGGWIDRNGVSCFNLYRPPNIIPGDPARAGRWLDHVHKVFPDDAGHVIRWLAQRVQRPQEKINHALVLGSKDQGVGKDTILEPVKPTIGHWNFSEPTPQQVMGRFNGFLKAVIVRINEARDLGEYDRFKFYDHTKAYTAAPPDVLRVDEKNLREHSILNCCGVIITTNYKTNGIYLPADDRRHFVAWSDLSKGDFADSYWDDIYAWYEKEGARNVAAYLSELDISDFNPKAPPPKTAAFWEIVDSARAPENSELADVLDKLGHPSTITLQQLISRAPEKFAEWLTDRKNSRQIPHRFEECDYFAVRNSAAKDGLWKVDGKRQVIYARGDLPLRERYRIAAERAGA
jgi:hypothetical protein